MWFTDSEDGIGYICSSCYNGDDIIDSFHYYVSLFGRNSHSLNLSKPGRHSTMDPLWGTMWGSRSLLLEGAVLPSYSDEKSAWDLVTHPSAPPTKPLLRPLLPSSLLIGSWVDPLLPSSAPPPWCKQLGLASGRLLYAFHSAAACYIYQALFQALGYSVTPARRTLSL